MVSGHHTASLGWGDCLYLLASRWPVVLLAGSLVWVAGAALKRAWPPLYRAEAVISVAVDHPGPAPLVESPEFGKAAMNDVRREAAELESRALLTEIAGPLGLAARWQIGDHDTLMERLASRIQITRLVEDGVLVVRASDLTRVDASALANAIADRFVTRKDNEAKSEASARVLRFEREIQERHSEVSSIENELVALASDPVADGGTVKDRRRRLAALRNLLHSLEAKHQLALLEIDEARGKARLVAPALPDRALSTVPFWLGAPWLMAGGLLAGMAVVLGGALVFRQSRWKILSDLIGSHQLHFAGFAPLGGMERLRTDAIPAALLEPYRELRNRLLRLPAGECVWMTVMPLRRGDAAAEAIHHLASVLADSGRSVLVIDADFRHPTMHLCFDAARHPGLSDYLSGEMRLEETVIRARRPNLWFMPAGPLHEDPGGLLNGKRMDDLVRDFRSRFQYVLVASPSIHESSDAALLSPLSEFTAVVTPYLGFSHRRLRETRVALETVQAPLSGVLMTTRMEGGDQARTPSRQKAGHHSPAVR